MSDSQFWQMKIKVYMPLWIRQLYNLERIVGSQMIRKDDRQTNEKTSANMMFI